MKDNKSTWIRLGLILVLSILSFVIFAALAEDVVMHEEISTIDPILGNWIVAHASSQGDRIFSAITFWGNGLVITIGTIVLTLWLSKGKRWDQLIFLDAAVGGASILDLILKQIFLRPRPDYPGAYLTEVSFSFPSGHAMLSIAFYGAVAYLAFAYLTHGWAKVLVTVGALAISGFIGFSRLYLGVHYFSDVLAGWVAGGFWLALCILVDQIRTLVRMPRGRSVYQ